MSADNRPTLSQINVYPIKSVHGIALSSAWVEKQGVVFDRRFMVADADGNMVTARTHPQLVRVKANLLPNGMRLSYGAKAPLTLNVGQFSMHEITTRVWKDSFNAYATTSEADEWFSDIIGQPVRLLYSGDQSNRVREKFGHSVSFADGYPLLVISEASLDELNKRSSEQSSMAQFRPNIVVSGEEAFAEDGWKRIRIGEVEFEIQKPCERCILTTVDVAEGRFNPSREPLKTLAKFRANERGGTFFGQNMVALNEGCIQVGDPVEVLETKEKEHYVDNSQESLKLTCVDREEVARNFVTYWFEPTHGVLPSYLPGQYLPVEVVCDGESYVRFYTLSSSPSRMGRYAISIKRVNDGRVSNYLIDNLKVGDVLSTETPQGGFHLDGDSDHPLLLISAGSGVTPMISMLRYLADHDQMRDVVFYHQCSTLEDIPFRDELDQLKEKFPGLRMIISLSQAHDEWEGPKGRLSLSHLRHIPQLEQRQAFVCGPQAFMSQAKHFLTELGLPETSFHHENFGSSETVSSAAQKTVSVTLDGTQFEGDNQSTLLEQAEKNGLPIINSCRAGLCGACMLKLESGEVDQADVPALTDTDRQNGRVLACCCTPKTDIEVSSGWSR